MSAPAGHEEGSALARFGALAFIYLAVGPGLAWAGYLLFTALAGDAPKYPGEALIAFYLFGAPGAVLAGVTHWFMRALPLAIGLGTGVMIAGLFGQMGGASGVLAAMLAASACHALARAVPSWF